MIVNVFPTSLYIKKNIITNDYLKILQNKVLELEKTIPSGGDNWYTDVKNSCDTHNLKNEKVFDILIDKITHHVNEFNAMMGSTHHYECNDCFDIRPNWCW
jgi:hypothetical protein